MGNELLPVALFVLITTFSPGPSNIAGAAMGVLYGYKRAFRFLLGMCAGFFVLMFLCAWASVSLLEHFPALASLLRYVGAVYILSLAYGMLKASYTFNDQIGDGQIGDNQIGDGQIGRSAGFAGGLLLQLLNPKLVVYGLTLFSTFFAPLGRQPAQLTVLVIGLALTAFCATSVWTLFGALIKSHLHQPVLRLAINALLALFLVYSALELVGVEAWLFG